MIKVSSEHQYLEIQQTHIVNTVVDGPHRSPQRCIQHWLAKSYDRG